MLRLRKQVDQIDRKLLRLLQQRTRLSDAIGRTKRRHGAEIYVPERERELLARVTKLSAGKLPPPAAAAIFREILSSSRAAQGQPPIGVLAASAEAVEPVARCHFGACDQIVAVGAWAQLAQQLVKGHLAIGLLTFAELAAVARERWRGDLEIIGEMATDGSLARSLFVIKAARAESAGNRALILIECKSTANAVKSLASAMPSVPQLVQLAPLRGGAKTCVAALTFSEPVTRKTLAPAGGTVLGIYPASESYGG